MNLVGMSLRLALRSPGTIPALLGMAWAFRARGWFTRFPFLPLPPPDYIQWRNETAYGEMEGTPPMDEFESFVRWSSRMRALMR